jgi:NAD+ synthase (glutamine-hydrolysing)
MIYENGSLLAEAERFAAEPQLILADIDLERLVMDRIRQNTFGDNADALRDRLAFRTVSFDRSRSRSSIRSRAGCARSSASPSCRATTPG